MSHGWAYYNEIDVYCAEWLRHLIKEKLIPDGEVDERSIRDVSPDDVRGFDHVHLFAGLGGWALAARLAGWEDDRQLWTGSPPCQPWSVAGRQRGAADDRHLWPEQHRLLLARRPPVMFVEQVAGAFGSGWFDGVCADLEGANYTWWAEGLPACAVNAPHRRDRIILCAADLVAHGDVQGRGDVPEFYSETDAGSGSQFRRHDERRGGQGAGIVADAIGTAPQRRREPGELPGSAGEPQGEGDKRQRCRDAVAGNSQRDVLGDTLGPRSSFRQERSDERGDLRREGSPALAPSVGDGGRGTLRAWDNYTWVAGADGKSRRVGTAVRQLASRLSTELDRACAEGAHPEVIPLLVPRGYPNRVPILKALGNAIVPQLAAVVMKRYLKNFPRQNFPS